MISLFNSFPVEADRLSNIHAVISYLPKESSDLVFLLISFLDTILQHSDSNKFTIELGANMLLQTIVQYQQDMAANLIQIFLFALPKSKELIALNVTNDQEFDFESPPFLVDLNKQKLSSKLSHLKTILLRLQELLKGRKKPDSAALEALSKTQQVMIALNHLVAYDMTFVQELIDTTNLELGEFHLEELEKILTDTKKGYFSSTRQRTVAEKMFMELLKVLEDFPVYVSP